MIGTRRGCFFVVFVQHESSLSIGFGKSKDEVKTALLTGVLLASPGKRWDTSLKYASSSSCSSEEFSRGESKQLVKED